MEVGAVDVPGGAGFGTDTEINVVDVGGAGAGGGGLDGALAYAMNATESNHLVCDASAYELAVTLTVHNDHANVVDEGGVPGAQSNLRLFLKDYDGFDVEKDLRAQEDIIYTFDITDVPKEQMVELIVPLDSPTDIYHDPPNGVGDSIVNFDPDDPFGAGTGGAFELQVAVPWASHGRFHITLHQVAIRETTLTPGDIDGDGDVDGTDFIQWQRGFGTQYDETDLGDWQVSFGAGGSLQASVGVVPEPSCVLLIVVGLVGSSLMKRDSW
jgi:hypothetical protein